MKKQFAIGILLLTFCGIGLWDCFGPPQPENLKAEEIVGRKIWLAISAVAIPGGLLLIVRSARRKPTLTIA